MPQHGPIKDAKTPFTLTPLEIRALELRRSGLKWKEISVVVGHSIKYLEMSFRNAVEKDRLRILAEKEKPGASTSLAEAKNKGNRRSDPRKGAWKGSNL